jgi:hypothetical protein
MIKHAKLSSQFVSKNDTRLTSLERQETKIGTVGESSRRLSELELTLIGGGEPATGIR